MSLKAKSDVKVFMGSFKTDFGIGVGVVIDYLGIEKCYKLVGLTSVFRAEIMSITKASELLLNKGISNKILTLFIDDVAVIKYVSTRTIKSRTVLNCRSILKKLGVSNKINVCEIAVRR